MKEKCEETCAEFWKDDLWGYLIHQKLWWTVLKKVAMSQELKFFENSERVAKKTIDENNKEK